ncbi:MAG: HAD family acid phosphatase [Candidatus Babeliales bacterium]|nr:HAD family acid phosphatase [Candidatus Babeliales bacterium]
MYNKFLFNVLMLSSFIVNGADLMPSQEGRVSPVQSQEGRLSPDRKSPRLVHLNDIKKMENLNEKHSAILRLIKYYEGGQYTKEVSTICIDALAKFSGNTSTEDSAIIFDIDETALTEYFVYKNWDFEWERSQMFEMRKQGKSEAIPGVLNLYKELKKLGYKIIFITARRESLNRVTSDNLRNEGYEDVGVKDGDWVLCLPDNYHGVKDAEGKPLDTQWKAMTRALLSKVYTIAGSISDSASDFKGGNAGECIKLPNYLY